MNRVTFTLFTALALVLASALLPAAYAQPYPVCPCTPSRCDTSCTCCGSSSQVTTIPTSNCTTGTTVHTLPGAIGNKLPTNVPNVLTTINGTCANGGCDCNNVCNGAATNCGSQCCKCCRDAYNNPYCC